eukprot:gene24388-29643_t
MSFWSLGLEILISPECANQMCHRVTGTLLPIGSAEELEKEAENALSSKLEIERLEKLTVEVTTVTADEGDAIGA